MLGVQHDQQEAQHDGDVQHQRDSLECLVAGVTQRMQQGTHDM